MTLRDGVTGEAILVSPALLVALPAGAGVLGVALDAMVESATERKPTGKLANALAETYADWLLKR